MPAPFFFFFGFCRLSPTQEHILFLTQNFGPPLQWRRWCIYRGEIRVPNRGERDEKSGFKGPVPKIQIWKSFTIKGIQLFLQKIIPFRKRKMGTAACPASLLLRHYYCKGLEGDDKGGQCTAFLTAFPFTLTKNRCRLESRRRVDWNCCWSFWELHNVLSPFEK